MEDLEQKKAHLVWIPFEVAFRAHYTSFMSHDAPLRRREREVFRGVFVIAALLVLVLQAIAIERQSLIGDASYHLLAGEQAWRIGTNAINLEHPPLVKLVAALPLLAEEPFAEPTSVEGVIDASLRLFDDPARARRARLRARAVLFLVFALPFLVACFLLGRRLGGTRAGAVLALATGLSFPILPHFSVVQTDTAVALGFTLTVLALLIWRERPGAARACGVGAAIGLAAATKFSAVLLAPVVVVVLLTANTPWRRKLGDLVLVALVALFVVEASYALANRSYDPEIGRDAIRRYCRGEALITGDTLRVREEPLLKLERVDPRLAQYFTGLLGIRAQNDLGVYPTYAFGKVASEGRWWFFPALLLTLIPLPVLAASGAALWHRRRAPPLAVGLTAGLYLAVALTSSYNLGIRHLLPILPLLYLPAALWAARNSRRTALLLALLALEAVLLTPRWMSATNTWWLGDHNPTRAAFSSGQSEYRQNFLLLDAELQRRGIERVGVLYPLLDEDELKTWVAGARLVRPGDAPRPGWYAVSGIVEQYLAAIEESDPEELRGFTALDELADRWQPLWRTVASGEDHGTVAGTFRLYRLRLVEERTAPVAASASRKKSERSIFAAKQKTVSFSRVHASWCRSVSASHDSFQPQARAASATLQPLACNVISTPRRAKSRASAPSRPCASEVAGRFSVTGFSVDQGRGSRPSSGSSPRKTLSRCLRS